MADGDYPKRPQFFACKFIRLMTKKCVANELGPQAFTLLTVVAMQEDARGYTSPVTFFNEQLMPLVGLTSVDTLDRVRKLAIKAGWLSYAPGAKRRPGRYFVTIPEQCHGTDDGPTDEGPDAEYLRTGAEVFAEEPACDRTGAEATGGHVRTEAEGMCGTSLPVPSPVPNTTDAPADARSAKELPAGKKQASKSGAKPQKPGEHDPLFCAFYAEYPLKEDRPAAWKAWQKLKPDAETAAEIMAGLRHYKATKPDWQHWKQPGPWLNARRWEDGSDAVVAAPSPVGCPEFGRQPKASPKE